MDEAEKQLLRMANGYRMAMQDTPAPIALSRRVTVGYRGKARLYYYPTNGRNNPYTRHHPSNPNTTTRKAAITSTTRRPGGWDCSD
jgi:hypothetical protein